MMMTVPLLAWIQKLKSNILHLRFKIYSPKVGTLILRGGEGDGGVGHRHTILPNFPKNCIKLKEFGPRERCSKFYYVDPPLKSYNIHTYFPIVAISAA